MRARGLGGGKAEVDRMLSVEDKRLAPLGLVAVRSQSSSHLQLITGCS